MVRAARLAATAALLVAFGATAQVQTAAPSSSDRTNHGADWPCIQPLVPTLSPAQIWAGPPVDEQIEQWRDHPELAPVVAQAVSRSVSDDAAVDAVDRFAEADGKVSDETLTLLFAGVFDEVNRTRSDVIDGIKRFARAQQNLLVQLQESVERLDAARAANPPDPQQVTALTEEVAWQRRILEERQRSLRALCEQPGVLETRLGMVARTIASHMD